MFPLGGAGLISNSQSSQAQAQAGKPKPNRSQLAVLYGTVL